MRRKIVAKRPRTMCLLLRNCYHCRTLRTTVVFSLSAITLLLFYFSLRRITQRKARINRDQATITLYHETFHYYQRLSFSREGFQKAWKFLFERSAQARTLDRRACAGRPARTVVGLRDTRKTRRRTESGNVQNQRRERVQGLYDRVIRPRPC